MDLKLGKTKQQQQRINSLIHFLTAKPGASWKEIKEYYENNSDIEGVSQRNFHVDRNLLKNAGFIIESGKSSGYKIKEIPSIENKGMLIPKDYAEELPILFSLLNQEQHLPSVSWLKDELREKYNVEEEAWENETYFSSSHIERKNDVELELCILIIRYMKKGQAITFKYRLVNTYKLKEYIVAPLQIRLSNDMYFLACCKYVEGRLVPKIVVFRIDMIENLKVQEATAQGSEDNKIDLKYDYKWLATATELKDYFKYCIGVINPNNGKEKIEPSLIKLKFKDWACSQVMKKKIHHTQTIPKGLEAEVVDGKEQIYCVVHIKVYKTEELMNLLGRYRDYVEELK